MVQYAQDLAWLIIVAIEEVFYIDMISTVLHIRSITWFVEMED